MNKSTLLPLQRAVFLRHQSWRSVPLVLAQSRPARLWGIKQVPSGWGVLLRTNSVHGVGIRESLTVLGIDAAGCLLAVRGLAPHRLVTCRGATWIAELAANATVPAPGSHLSLVRAAGPAAFESL